jgi:DNA-binding MarR family transcriptional regulator
MAQKSHDRSAEPESARAASAPRENEFEGIDALADSFDRFMRPFLVRLNPIIHSTVWRGKRFTEKHIIVVMAVKVSGPLSPSELSRTLKLQKGSLTTIIRGLCQSGMIERRETQGDERSYRLVITAVGLEFAEHMAAQRRSGFRQQFAGLPEPQCRLVSRALDTLVDYLERDLCA